MKTNAHSIQSISRVWQFVGALLLLVFTAIAACAASIVDSKHNLAISGPGGVKATLETEICIFCHTPHQKTGDVPLWNHAMPVQQYTPYSSTTLKATDVRQPTGASKLCLSCHDGTVALGMVNSRRTQIQMRDAVTTMPPGSTRLGTDLSDDHPISFKYDSALASQNPELKDPTTLDARVRLDHDRQLQCTSCHDPHNDQFGKFLVQDNAGSALCLNCHVPNRWKDSAHKISTATWNGQGINPWPHTSEPTVAANACASCHASHNAGTKPRLLNSAVAEQNCLPCHNGNVAVKNLQPEFEKFSAHPIITTGHLHDEAEDFINPTRHVGCVDCHNAHAAQASDPGSLHAAGSLVGVRGVSSLGTVVNPVTKEAQLCYRCHGDSIGKGPAVVTRRVAETNKRLQFAGANASFHPIEAVGRNSSVPSLISPWTVTSTMTCSDCHNNNQGPGAGGTGARGPHGSQFSPILEREMVFVDNQAESPAAYAMCYKCHSRTSILADESFPHRLHVVDEQTSCTTCHDSHGVASAPALINFNTAYVSAFSSRIEFNRSSPFSGNCTLTCHSHDHDASAYGAGAPIQSQMRKLLRTPPKRKVR